MQNKFLQTLVTSTCIWLGLSSNTVAMRINNQTREDVNTFSAVMKVRYAAPGVSSKFLDEFHVLCLWPKNGPLRVGATADVEITFGLVPPFAFRETDIKAGDQLEVSLWDDSRKEISAKYAYKVAEADLTHPSPIARYLRELDKTLVVR